MFYVLKLRFSDQDPRLRQSRISFSVFFFNDTATTEIYTLSLHDALPIWTICVRWSAAARSRETARAAAPAAGSCRSEEHTSELQSRQYLVCRLLLEKKNIRCLQATWGRARRCWRCTTIWRGRRPERRWCS